MVFQPQYNYTHGGVLEQAELCEKKAKLLATQMNTKDESALITNLPQEKVLTKRP